MAEGRRGAQTVASARPSSRRADHASVLAVLLVIALGFGWGFNWPSIKLAVSEISVWPFRAWVLVVGGALLMLTARLQGRRLRMPRAEWRPFLLVSFLNISAYQVIVAAGIGLMEAGRGAILGFTFPLWTVLIGWFVLKEPLTRARLVALVCGLGAMALLIIPDITIVGRSPLGAGLIVLSAVVWAAGTVAFKHYRWSLPPLEMTAWQISVGSIPVVIGALVLAPLPDVSVMSWPAMAGCIYSAVVGIFLGQWIWYRTLNSLPAAVASISSLCIPIVGVFSSALILGETVTWLDLVALALVCAALFMVLIGSAGIGALVRKGQAGP